MYFSQTESSKCSSIFLFNHLGQPRTARDGALPPVWLTLVDCVKFEKCTNHHLQERWLVLLTCLRLASNSADFPAAISHPEFNLLMKLEAAKPLEKLISMELSPSTYIRHSSNRLAVP